jgi:hypothetical protein
MIKDLQPSDINQNFALFSEAFNKSFVPGEGIKFERLMTELSQAPMEKMRGAIETRINEPCQTLFGPKDFEYGILAYLLMFGDLPFRNIKKKISARPLPYA